MGNDISQFSLLRKLKIIDTEAFPWADSIMGKTTMILFNVHIESPGSFFTFNIITVSD